MRWYVVQYVVRLFSPSLSYCVVLYYASESAWYDCKGEAAHSAHCTAATFLKLIVRAAPDKDHGTRGIETLSRYIRRYLPIHRCLCMPYIHMPYLHRYICHAKAHWKNHETRSKSSLLSRWESASRSGTI